MLSSGKILIFFTSLSLRKLYFALPLVFTGILAVSSVYAQIPRTISYQGLLISPSGVPIGDGKHVIKVSFYDNVNALTDIYNDAQDIPTKEGLFNMIIGAVTPIPATVDFSKPYWLGVSVDGGAEMSPRTALTSVPYALHAEVADRAIYILS